MPLPRSSRFPLPVSTGLLSSVHGSMAVLLMLLLACASANAAPAPQASTTQLAGAMQQPVVRERAPESLPSPPQDGSRDSLAGRFATAHAQMTGKLVRLFAFTPLLVIALAIVLLSAWIGGSVSRRMRWLRLRTRNPYMEGLLRRIVHAGMVLVGVVVALDLLGATSLVGAVLGSAGLVGLVLGFAFKDIAENYIAGILLSLRRPFAPGDHVAIEGKEGKVIALSSRATILMTLDGNHLQLPNSLVFKSVLLNYSRNPLRRFEFTTVVDADASWHDALEIAVDAIGRIPGVLAEPAPSGQIRELSNDGATLQLSGWIDQRGNDLGRTRSEAMRLVRGALRNAGITPPEPVQRVRLVRDAEPVGAATQDDTERTRDISVDHAVDAQLDAARQGEEGNDLLSAEKTPR